MKNPPVLPIIIGVTGHRDIAPEACADVRHSVRALLKDWKRRFRDALQVMTALAEGADQLVADEASALKIPIIAVAPMPRDRYLRTMQTENGRSRFAVHWENAVLQIALPEIGEPDDPDYNDRHFEQLGVLLARRSHLLIALWDGESAVDDRSGTSAVARMRLRGDYDAIGFERSPMFSEVAHMLDMTYRGPLLRIHTPRDTVGACTAGAGACFLDGLPEVDSNSDRPVGRAAQIRQFMRRCLNLIVERDTPRVPSITPDQEIEPALIHCAMWQAKIEEFERIDTLNRHIASLHGSDILLFQQQIVDLKTCDLPGYAGDLVTALKRAQAGVDTVAQVFQGRLLGHFVPERSPYHMLARGFRIWKTQGRNPCPGVAFLFAMVVPAAVFAYEAYSHLRWGLAGLVLYLSLLGGAAGFQWRYLDDHIWQNRFQDYRALAEGLRVQLFWAIAALPAAVPDYYLRKQVGELGWIQFAMRGPALWALALADEIRIPDHEAVKYGWIEDQRNYFRRRARLYEHAALTGQFWTRTFLILGLITSAALFLARIAWPGEGNPDNIIAMILKAILNHQEYVGVLMITLPALAAAFTVSRELRFYEAHAHSYALMERIFNRAVGAIERVNEIRDASLRNFAFQRLIRELGREALVENAEWLVAHRYRPIEHGQ
jgi:hypothetical protein